MKLLCRSRYASALYSFEPGVIDVDDHVAEFLLRDAPGVFEAADAVPPSPPKDAQELGEEVKAPDEPPLDKAIKAPARKKSR